MLEIKKGARKMGNHFEITIVTENQTEGENLIEGAFQEIDRIEKLFTTFDEKSQINKINQNAGKSAVKVEQEVFDLIDRSLRISKTTDGAFDITYGSVDLSLWNFNTKMTKLPDPETAKKRVELIDYKKIKLETEKCTVYLEKEGMRIGFGGIGKGYAAEKAKEFLKKYGIQSGIVNASGDICAWGKQANGEPWRVGIVHPDFKNLPFSYLSISDWSIATSGNYEKFAIIDGKKYSHTINPKTGMPVTGIKSVTIFSPNAEISDAMATPVTIMGINAGMNLINQIQHLECIIIDDQNKIYTSKNIHLHEK